MFIVYSVVQRYLPTGRLVRRLNLNPIANKRLRIYSSPRHIAKPNACSLVVEKLTIPCLHSLYPKFTFTCQNTGQSLYKTFYHGSFLKTVYLNYDTQF